MKHFLLLSVCLVALSGHFLTGQAPKATSAPQVQLQAAKPLRKGVDAWPLIANPSTPEQQRVNATLTRLNAHMQKSLAECDQNAREAFKEQGNDAPKGTDPTADDWERTIKVTMTGPRFLSLVATDEADCGGAHPDSDTLAMVFDLTTGAPANWVTLLAKSANASTYSDSITDGTKVGALVVPALLAMSKAKADADCKDAFQDPQSYQLWPDAKSGKLIAEPFDLPHAVAACAEDLALTTDQARKLGFDEGLLGAIEQAHRQSLPAPH